MTTSAFVHERVTTTRQRTNATTRRSAFVHERVTTTRQRTNAMDRGEGW